MRSSNYGKVTALRPAIPEPELPTFQPDLKPNTVTAQLREKVIHSLKKKKIRLKTIHVVNFSRAGTLEWVWQAGSRGPSSAGARAPDVPAADERVQDRHGTAQKGPQWHVPQCAGAPAERPGLAISRRAGLQALSDLR